MDNKVVQTLARAFIACGWTAVRFNFRGVGASAGMHDEGRGRDRRLPAVMAQVAPDGPIALAGFSFGAFVAINALADAVDRARRAPGGAGRRQRGARCAVAPLPAEAHERTLVVHGEADDTVPFPRVIDWARPQTLPVTVVPGGGHFFHGQLPLLKNLVVRHLRA